MVPRKNEDGGPHAVKIVCPGFSNSHVEDFAEKIIHVKL